MSGESGMTARLMNALYMEVLLLSDEARSYFDDRGHVDRRDLGPLDRVAFTSESLRITTRLMHVTAWLLKWRDSQDEAIVPGGMRAERRLAIVNECGASDACLPQTVEILAVQSRDLYDRVRRLDAQLHPPRRSISPARNLIHRLERVF